MTLPRLAVANTIFYLLFSLIHLSCAGADEASMEPEQLARMQRVRQELRESLGVRYNLPVPPATEEQLKRGAALYPQICASCHGGRGDGKGKVSESIAGNPTSFKDPKQALFFSEQARLRIIRKGIKGTPMMGWESVLSDADILAVYVYVRSLMRTNQP